MTNNDIIVLIEFDYEHNHRYRSYRKTIQRFPLIEDESDIGLEQRIYKWLEEKGYERTDICNLRLIYEGGI